MSVQILADKYDETACLYCDTTDWAFGPVFYSPHHPRGWPASDYAQCFCDWFTDGQHVRFARAVLNRAKAPGDPRAYSEHELELLYGEWQRVCTDKDGFLRSATLADGSTDWVWQAEGVPS